MELLCVGDLHLTASDGTGGLSKYIEDPDQFVVSEVDKVLAYGRSKGLNKIIFPGDIFDGPRGSYPGMLALSGLFSSNPDFTFYLMTGNHDLYGLTPDTGHSLQILQNFKQPNVRYFTRPKSITVDGVDVRFLPYPSTNFDPNALNIFHNEVYGSKGDSGRLATDESLSKSKAVAIGGHLHTAHRIRNTHYCGTLYQTNFGESLPKYFHHIEFNSAQDFNITLVNHEPKYKLHNIVLEHREDLKLIPHSKFDLVKLVIQDGADVGPSDWASLTNIAIIKNYKSKSDLALVLTEDLSECKELIIKTEDFFQTWVRGLDVDVETRKHVCQVRRRVLNNAKES